MKDSFFNEVIFAISPTLIEKVSLIDFSQIDPDNADYLELKNTQNIATVFVQYDNETVAITSKDDSGIYLRYPITDDTLNSIRQQCLDAIRDYELERFNPSAEFIGLPKEDQ